MVLNFHLILSQVPGRGILLSDENRLLLLPRLLLVRRRRIDVNGVLAFQGVLRFGGLDDEADLVLRLVFLVHFPVFLDIPLDLSVARQHVLHQFFIVVQHYFNDRLHLVLQHGNV